MNPAELGPTQRPLLENNEKIICMQHKVGLYQGSERDIDHDCGSVYLTSRRLFYVDQLRPRENSLSLDLTVIDRCTFHTGFLYSSSKIHLYLKQIRQPKNKAASKPARYNWESSYSTAAATEAASGSVRGLVNRAPASADWKCTICDNINRGGAKCVLCGVPRQGGESESAARAEEPNESFSLVDADALQEETLRCPVCTFDNHQSMARCEMCDAELTKPPATEPQQTRGSEQSSGDNSSGGSSGDPLLIKLSFRGGGGSGFYASLKDAVSNSSWLVVGMDALPNEPTPPPLQKPLASHMSQLSSQSIMRDRPTAGGISTIVSTAHQTERARDVTLRSAFSDLDALTEKANELVSMAEHIATQLNSPAASKLRRHGMGEEESEEDTEQRAHAFRQYLLDLGIDSPVTRDSAGTMFHDELARELCDYLENYVSQSGGTVALVDAYCLYNRAREFSLVYPSDFVQACEKFEALGLPLRLRAYPSGLLALEDASSASDDVIIGRVRQYVGSFGPITASDLAAIEDCPLTLAEERLWLCERVGTLCRDESAEGTRFYANAFLKAGM
ncbi:Vacuolar protein-sorting-associated protein 36 [Coemansia sp. Benny D115]|nr:Vacuolar protein-sorting-associated protein 36 [Coemansia sp. Benny D115]